MNKIDEFKNYIIKLKQEFDAINGDDYNELKDLEWIYYRVDLALCEICKNMGLKVNNFPPNNYKQLEKEDVINHEHWKYYLNKCIINNEKIAELNYFYFQLFWPHLNFSKEDISFHIEVSFDDDPLINF